MVGETGFEPATLWSQTRCATRLRYSPTLIHLERMPNSAPVFDPIRLSPAPVGPAGFEPAT